MRTLLRLFAFAVIAFKGWMLVDAYQRRADTYWLWIILAVPGGSLVYLFMVRLRAPDAQLAGRRLLKFLERPVSLQELELQYQESASAVNRLRLAQGLADAGRYAEAALHFAGVVEKRPTDCDALFGLGVCRLEQGDADAAIDPLRQVTELSPLYREFAAYPELADALDQAGRRDDALELLADLARRQPILPNVVLYSRLLAKAGQSVEAHDLLAQGLRRYEQSPRHVRRMYRRAAGAARAMLKGH